MQLTIFGYFTQNKKKIFGYFIINVSNMKNFRMVHNFSQLLWRIIILINFLYIFSTIKLMF